MNFIYLESVATALGLTLWIASLCLVSLGTILTVRHLRKTPKHLDAPFGLFPVSILKPLKGSDPNLKKNLDSFFGQNYPKFELLFSISNGNDPARKVVEELQLKYPNISSRLFIAGKEVGANPKINNMIESYNKAQFDFILISDSNVLAPRDMLKRLMAQVETGVGIITSVVAGVGAMDGSAQLESAQLNTFYARGMFLAEYFGKSCVVGKSMLFQRSVAQRFGGLQTLSQYIAEDQMAGEAMKKLGLKIQMSVDPVVQVIGNWSTRDFWQRHLRWGRLRKMHSPLTFCFEPLVQQWVSGIIGWTSLSAAFQLLGYIPSFSIFVSIHFGIWGLNEYFLLKTMHHRSGSKMSWLVPIYAVIRAAIDFPLWVHIALGDRVEWRGQQIQLGAGGVILKVKA